MDSYFNQLMEIQNSTDHSFFLLDQDSEPRFVIEADKRTIIIPAEFQFLGVKTDQRSEKIYFEVDRIFDDVDLSTKTCVIQYINAGTDDVDEGIYAYGFLVFLSLCHANNLPKVSVVVSFACG